MTGEVLNDVSDGAPGPGQLRGTDLQIAHNLQGDSLVLRVNKAGVLVFRAMLHDAVPPMLESRLLRFNSFAPDLVFSWRRGSRTTRHRRGAACWPGWGGRRYAKRVPRRYGNVSTKTRYPEKAIGAGGEIRSPRIWQHGAALMFALTPILAVNADILVLQQCARS